ncbi:MAG: 5-(carboxyamino)imidazole ribonucleotide synthase [Rickettsiales bacterium]|nr:5-(carboxyamino)imidazole ribonucleotide synthase [Rickettsiales bacterium]
MANNKFPLSPGSVIGILGGGQLGRMMAMAAAHMGYHVHIYTPEENSPASEVAQFTTVASYDDREALQHFAKSVQVVTYEFENIPAAPVKTIAQFTPVYPDPDVLSISQQRVWEKQALQKLGIKTAPFAVVNNASDLRAAIDTLGRPAILKTCRMGYDGKGQWTLRSDKDVTDALELIERSAVEYILEGFVNFKMEISVIVARDIQGNIACYDPVQNIHKNHILHQTIAPAPISPQLALKAQNMACDIAEGFKLVGLIAVEMFVTNDEHIVVNELAPRPHNSGHWTMDACITSQFEQCIRAVCGLPLGHPNRFCDAKMLNLIGPDVHDWSRYVGEPNVKVHLYGKQDVRAGRKMGHVTFLDVKHG